MGRYEQPKLLSHCPSHPQSTQTQPKRKSTHQEHPLLPAPTATRFHQLRVGLETRTILVPKADGLITTPCFVRKNPGLGACTNTAVAVSPGQREAPPVCAAHGATLAVQPQCSWQPHSAGKLCPPHQTILQLDFTCNHQVHAALTQDCKDSSEEDIDSVITPKTPWLALDSSRVHHRCNASIDFT